MANKPSEEERHAAQIMDRLLRAVDGEDLGRLIPILSSLLYYAVEAHPHLSNFKRFVKEQLTPMTDKIAPDLPNPLKIEVREKKPGNKWAKFREQHR